MLWLRRSKAMQGWDRYNLQALLLYTLVKWDKLFSLALFLCIHVARHAGRLPRLAASDSRPGNDQQTAVTRGQKSLLTRACLTLLTQAISSFYHARLSGFPPHPLATHVLITWAQTNEHMQTNGSTWSCIYEIQGLFYLASTAILWVHIYLSLRQGRFVFTLLPFTLSIMKEMTLSVIPRLFSTGCIVVSAGK